LCRPRISGNDRDVSRAAIAVRIFFTPLFLASCFPAPRTGLEVDGGSSAAGGSSGSGGRAEGGAGGVAVGGGGAGGSGVGGAGAKGGGVAGGAVGSGGTIGAGGTTGAGGNGTGGTGGMTGAGGSQAGGAGGSLLDVAKPLDGKMLLSPCMQDIQAATCYTQMGNCPQNTTDRALSGALLTDISVTLGGMTAQSYAITLHVQGEVESKSYLSGQDADSVAASPTANGFCTGGTPTTADNYNVYLVRVTDPGANTHVDYFLNSLNPPGVSNHTTYGVDYMATITAKGGSTVRLVAADSNCNQIKNCGPTQNAGTTCAAPITLQGIEPSAVTSNTTFDFTTPYNGQWLVLTVKNVALSAL
jgi:hypothetical protein